MLFHFFYGVLAHSSRSSELNLSIPVHFGSLMWTKDVDVFSYHLCLTTSNLSWFMDLTFQFLRSTIFCSIGFYFHHQTHPWLSVISTLAQPLHSLWAVSRPGAYWTPADLGGSSFGVMSFCPFHTVHGVLKARTLKWLAIFFSSFLLLSFALVFCLWHMRVCVCGLRL